MIMLQFSTIVNKIFCNYLDYFKSKNLNIEDLGWNGEPYEKYGKFEKHDKENNFNNRNYNNSAHQSFREKDSKVFKNHEQNQNHKYSTLSDSDDHQEMDRNNVNIPNYNKSTIDDHITNLENGKNINLKNKHVTICDNTEDDSDSLEIKIKNLQNNKKEEKGKIKTSAASQPNKIPPKLNKDLNKKKSDPLTQKNKKNSSTNQGITNSSKPMTKSKSMSKMNNAPTSVNNKTLNSKNTQTQNNRLKSKGKESNFSTIKNKTPNESFKNEKKSENESVESMKAELQKLRQQVKELTFDNERLKEELFREKEQNNKIRNFAEEVMKFYNQ
jgi:hypothetical protein